MNNTNTSLVTSQISDLTSDYASFLYLKLKNLLLKTQFTDLEQELLLRIPIHKNNQKIMFNLHYINLLSLFKQTTLTLMNSFTFFKTKPRTKTTQNLLSQAKTELNNLIAESNGSSRYQFEKTTQMYMEYNYISAIFLKRKNEYVNALSLLVLSINLMRVFLTKHQCAKDPRTYYIYTLNLLFLIEMLIEDNEYEKSLNYQNMLFNTCMLIFDCGTQYGDFLRKYKDKLIIILCICFCYRGFCYECLGAGDEFIFASYKQAYYLGKNACSTMEKFHLLFFVIQNIIRGCIIKEQNKEKLKNGIIETINTKHQTNKTENNNKNNKLNSQINVSNVEYVQNSKQVEIFKRAQAFIEKDKEMNQKELLTQDNELIDFVDNYLSFNSTNRRKNQSLSERNHLMSPTLSHSIKSQLCHHEIYKNLLSKKYQGYVLIAENLEFDNPLKRKEALSQFEKYIKFNREQKNQTPRQKDKIKNKSFLASPLYIKKAQYIESLDKKDLRYQKSFLNFKSINSKFYYLNHTTSNELINDLTNNEEDNDQKIKEKANRAFLRIQNSISEKMDEFNYKKYKSYNLYAKVFQSANKKKATRTMSRLLAGYRKKMKRNKLDINKLMDREYILNNNYDKIGKLNQEIEHLEKRIKLKK